MVEDTEELMAGTHLPRDDDGDGEQRLSRLLSWPATKEARTDLLVIGAVTSMLTWAAGPTGIVAGVVLVGLWSVLPNVAVFAIGQIIITALLGGEALSIGTLVPVATLGGLLTTTGISDGIVRNAGLLYVLWVGIAVIVAVIYLWTAAVWVAAAVSLAVAMAGFISLAIHSYRQVGDEYE
ncbi:hypothetical protein HZS55_06065 [Halosimplex rubrum]|uniref:DUF8163 domain-containing protein n=1 Tax=Halosimplex rubrum TaxID=869889 RepID=A0A7D5T4H5_9EURY|nr:hypothetical protein [Halosimplex rubrum]QLH76893.1 hypothetical protein HZS55_06065 [Halosimplex rubrum]